MWAQLTNRAGQRILVNLNHSYVVEPDLGGAKIVVAFVNLGPQAPFAPVAIEVKESYEEVAKIIQWSEQQVIHKSDGSG